MKYTGMPFGMWALFAGSFQKQLTAVLGYEDVYKRQNKYGTPSPVPFRVVDQRAGIDIDIAIRCFGEYSYRITNPILFYTNVCGNVEEGYTRDEIDGQLKSELMTALQQMCIRDRVIYEPIGVIGAAQYLLPGWERKHKLMTVVCQHQAEQYHRKYKNHVPALVQRGGLPPIQKEKRIKCKGRDLSLIHI